MSNQPIADVPNKRFTHRSGSGIRLVGEVVHRIEVCGVLKPASREMTLSIGIY
jgi:hypothetical protein